MNRSEFLFRFSTCATLLALTASIGEDRVKAGGSPWLMVLLSVGICFGIYATCVEYWGRK